MVPQERRTGGAGFLYLFFLAVIDLITFLARLAHGDDELTHSQDETRSFPSSLFGIVNLGVHPFL